MKKIVALLLAVIMMASLSVTAFAAVSPEASKKLAVVVLIDDGSKPAKQMYEVKTEVKDDMEVLTVTANEPKEGSKFTGWAFYHKDGTVAKIDSDYYVIDGTTLAFLMKFIPLSDLIIVATYDNKTPDLTEAIKLFDSTSPKMGDNMAFVLAGMFALALCGVVIAKKQLAK